jgi:hypothetical protein
MDYEPQHLKLWKRPSYYIGESWPEYYVFLGQNRDSSTLERSNFTCALEAIGGESETVTVVREGHWAVGWIEWIAIHQDDSKALEIADEIVAALSDYPVVNESHWSELEFNEVCDYWANMSVAERVGYLRKFDMSIFAARRSELPEDPSGYLYDYLRQ